MTLYREILSTYYYCFVVLLCEFWCSAYCYMVYVVAWFLDCIIEVFVVCTNYYLYPYIEMEYGIKNLDFMDWSTLSFGPVHFCLTFKLYSLYFFTCAHSIYTFYGSIVFIQLLLYLLIIHPYLYLRWISR
jgi:hypothetical protein